MKNPFTGKTVVIFAVLLIAIITGLSLWLYDMSVDNRIVSLQNLFTKQTAAVEAYHDKMWKTIQSQSQITDKQKDAFKDIYIGIMNGRYSKGDGTLMKWIKEDNPKFDQSSYIKLMTTVEAQREGFFREQDMIQATVKEYNDMLRQKPAKWFIADGTKELLFIPISSTASKEVMETRKDDKLHL
jgi:hypothetical protein